VQLSNKTKISKNSFYESGVVKVGGECNGIRGKSKNGTVGKNVVARDGVCGPAVAVWW
jgi:hypothetical protein